MLDQVEDSDTIANRADDGISVRREDDIAIFKDISAYALQPIG